MDKNSIESTVRAQAAQQLENIRIRAEQDAKKRIAVEARARELEPYRALDRLNSALILSIAHLMIVRGKAVTLWDSAPKKYELEEGYRRHVVQQLLVVLGPSPVTKVTPAHTHVAEVDYTRHFGSDDTEWTRQAKIVSHHIPSGVLDTVIGADHIGRAENASSLSLPEDATFWEYAQPGRVSEPFLVEIGSQDVDSVTGNWRRATRLARLFQERKTQVNEFDNALSWVNSVIDDERLNPHLKRVNDGVL